MNLEILIFLFSICGYNTFGYFWNRGDLSKEAATSFTFSALENDRTKSMDTKTNEVQSRHLVTGTIPKIVNPFSVVTCICVPPGGCPVPSTPTPAIDVRIVNVAPQQPERSPRNTCSYGLVLCCQPGPYQCGKRYPSPPGSAPAAPGQAAFGEYPWQVALLKINEYIGSGALIDDRHVLTTAHKVFNITTKILRIRLGEWNSLNIGEPVPAEDFNVQNIILHPGFNKDNLMNDIAIIRLTAHVDLNRKSTIGTVCLPTVSFVNRKCYVAGWGKDAFGPFGTLQPVQRDVDVSLIPNSVCTAALRKTRLGPSFVLNDASFICAGGENGKDACTGDGGSPLVCEHEGHWFVVGLVAWGIGCAMPGVPGVYVNVATYLPWIHSALATF